MSKTITLTGVPFSVTTCPCGAYLFSGDERVIDSFTWAHREHAKKDGSCEPENGLGDGNVRDVRGAGGISDE